MRACSRLDSGVAESGMRRRSQQPLEGSDRNAADVLTMDAAGHVDCMTDEPNDERDTRSKPESALDRRLAERRERDAEAAALAESPDPADQAPDEAGHAQP